MAPEGSNFAAEGPGTLTILVPGTEWTRWRAMYQSDSQPMKSIAGTFRGTLVLFEWSGANDKAQREGAGAALSDFIQQQLVEHRPAVEELNLIGFSHGGNVAALATQHLGGFGVDHLFTIATPVLAAYQPAPLVHHINIYNPHDPIQVWGGETLCLPGRGTVGRAGRTFAGASNIAIPIAAGSAQARHGDLLYREETWSQIRAHLKPGNGLRKNYLPACDNSRNGGHSRGNVPIPVQSGALQ